MASGAAGAVDDPRSWRTTQHPNGTDTELLTIHRVAKLFVLCGDRFASRQIQAGDLSVRIVRCTGGPVSMVTCKVGDHQWLLAKDSMAIRIGMHSFFFVLPAGMLYGLVLPAFGRPDRRYDMLQEIFENFSAYLDIVEVGGCDTTNTTDSEPDDWTGAYSALPKLNTRSNAKSSPPGAVATIGAARMHKAMRMSAAVKLISRSLLNGTLRPKDHLHVSVAPDVAHAYPTMGVVTNLFDALEFSTPPAYIIAGRVPPQGFWGFKEEGLASLFESVRYSVAGKSKRPRVYIHGGCSRHGAEMDEEEEEVEEVEKRVVIDKLQ